VCGAGGESLAPAAAGASVRPPSSRWARSPDKATGLIRSTPGNAKFQWPRRKTPFLQIVKSKYGKPPSMRGASQTLTRRRRPALPGVAGDHRRSNLTSPPSKWRSIAATALEIAHQAQKLERGHPENQPDQQGWIGVSGRPSSSCPDLPGSRAPTPRPPPPLSVPRPPTHEPMQSVSSGSPQGICPDTDVVQERAPKPTVRFGPINEGLVRRLHPCPGKAAAGRSLGICVAASMDRLAPRATAPCGQLTARFPQPPMHARAAAATVVTSLSPRPREV